MPNYHVSWGAEITAKTALEAADVARDMLTRERGRLTLLNIEQGGKKWQAVITDSALTVRERAD